MREEGSIVNMLRVHGFAWLVLLWWGPKELATGTHQSEPATSAKDMDVVAALALHFHMQTVGSATHSAKDETTRWQSDSNTQVQT